MTAKCPTFVRSLLGTAFAQVHPLPRCHVTTMHGQALQHVRTSIAQKLVPDMQRCTAFNLHYASGIQTPRPNGSVNVLTSYWADIQPLDAEAIPVPVLVTSNASHTLTCRYMAVLSCMHSNSWQMQFGFISRLNTVPECS